MEFPAFIESLSESELRDYAALCKTTAGYITTHLKPARKTPRMPLFAALWQNSVGKLTQQDIVNHFYQTQADENVEEVGDLKNGTR